MASDGNGDGRAQVTLIRIFLSSPGDVPEERKLARQVIDTVLTKLPGLRGRVALELVAWDDPAASIPLLAQESPQDSVNAARPRPANCDIVIVVLWARMGTPLPDTIRKPNGRRYQSGTEWEYQDAITSPHTPRPEVLVYRRTEEPMISLRDPKKKEKEQQFGQVEAFFARLLKEKRGFNSYATPAEFERLLRQHLEEILHRCLGPAAADGKAAPTPAAPIIPPEYADWLQASVERVELLGAKEGRSVTLNYVYVPALARMHWTPPQEENLSSSMVYMLWQHIVVAQQLSLFGELKPLLIRLDQESLYVPAPAGAGKSTFCRWAALQSVAVGDLAHPVPAPEDFTEPVPQDLRRRLPLLVPLREFGRGLDCGRGQCEWRRTDLERALAGWIDRSPPEGLTGELVLTHLRVGSAFLLLDGLDEVSVTEVRDGVTVYPRALLLSGLADALPTWLTTGNRVVLTSRPYGLDEAGLHRLGLPKAELEPLPRQLQDLFVTRWFACLKKPDKTADLIATIRDRADLAPLAGNPMLLTALCVLYDNGGRLPEDRYDLYRSIVDGVLYSRYPGDAKEREPVARRLEAIALGMHLGDDRRPRVTPAAEVSWAEVEWRLAEFAEWNPAYEAGQVEAAGRREDLLNHSGLLVPRPDQRAAFYHLSFQEFLAAQRLARKPKDIDGVFLAHRAVPEWRPTLLFLLAAHIANCDAQSGFDLIELLIGDQDRMAVKAEPNPAVLIAEAIELCLAKNYEVPPTLKERFQRLALDAIQDEVALPARQALGLCLGRLGDPRIRSLTDHDAYIEIPAGTYRYSPKGMKYRIEVPVRIGRYQVTNSQYREFLEGGGYRERKWWSDSGWAWLKQEQVTEPALRRDRRWNAPNQPVVGVSFWEAEACAAWAGGRLPTEQEWEAAARGSRGLVYPWGNDWSDGIANTAEAGLGVTSPVGLFPRSHQAGLGIVDLAGNVWEWCASLHASQQSEGSRVLRGGSWNRDRGNARSSFRHASGPNSRDDSVGFRVVCSSPIAGS